MKNVKINDGNKENKGRKRNSEVHHHPVALPRDLMTVEKVIGNLKKQTLTTV